MKKIALIDKNDSNNLTKILENYFLNKDTEIYQTDKTDDINSKDWDIVVLNDYNNPIDETLLEKTKVINIHPSLLPAFEGENAISETFIAGVKVGGVTIHSVKKNPSEEKIIAQYPVLIGITTHIDEYIKELEAVIFKILPPVIDSILNDKVFDFKDLFKSGCGSACSSCKGCSNK